MTGLGQCGAEDRADATGTYDADRQPAGPGRRLSFLITCVPYSHPD